MINKTVVLDGDCQLIIPQDGELGVVTAIRKPYPPYTGDTIVTPSDSIQVLNTELTTLTDNIIVNPVPGDYVGGDIPRRDDDDLTASGATVTAPAGYYEDEVAKSVQIGSAGTPTATKSAVSDHSVSVTPSVTNAEGYINGGTKNGTPITVTAEELESGTKSITENGTGIDVTGYAEVDVEVPSVEPVLQTISKTYTPSTSQQTEEVTASAGYDAIEKVNVMVNPMPTGTEGTPTASKGAVSNHSVAVTPSVTNAAGYIPGGTKAGTPVTVSASELDSGAKAITANGNGQDVVGYASVNVSVPNSYTASDEGKVVNNGALVAQTARSISANGTYDTTTNNSVSVSVPSQSPVINPLTVTENGTYTAPSGVDGYSPVTVNVSGGGGLSVDDIATRSYGSIIYGASAETIDTYAFAYNKNLVEVNFPSVVSIGGDAFEMCSKLTSVSFPAAVSVGNFAFSGCRSLSTIYFPELSTIGQSAFASCTRFTSIELSKVTSVGISAFVYCTSLTNVSLPAAIDIGTGAFIGCSRLNTVNIPECVSVGGYCFSGCSSLENVSAPKLNTISANAFAYCPMLSELSLPSVSRIFASAFRNSVRLISLNLTQVASVPVLSNSNAFTTTPIGGYTASAGQLGSIYVPASLYDTFQTAANWSYYSSRMVSV